MEECRRFVCCVSVHPFYIVYQFDGEGLCPVALMSIDESVVDVGVMNHHPTNHVHCESPVGHDDEGEWSVRLADLGCILGNGISLVSCRDTCLT
jgi:hypothetical protein